MEEVPAPGNPGGTGAKPAPYRGRFAPSPTGPLHFGSLVTALGSFLRARACGGTWLVRIEDLDTPRVVPGAATEQLASLQRFGLHWDGPVLRQSDPERQAAYRAALQRLQADGQLIACRCSRSELDGRPHRACAPGADDGPAALRLHVPARRIAFDDLVHGRQSQHLALEVGDFVLRRRDGLVAYQLAVVVDDAEQGITEVVRGADLLDSTPRQLHLQQCLGLPSPRHVHLPLVLDANGCKVSKSSQAPCLETTHPLRILRKAWRFLGQRPGAVVDAGSVDAFLELAVAAFEITRVPRQSTLPKRLPNGAPGDPAAPASM